MGSDPCRFTMNLTKMFCPEAATSPGMEVFGVGVECGVDVGTFWMKPMLVLSSIETLTHALDK
jgi:hypothetical protein